MVDLITREIIQRGLEYIAEEMGLVLRNSAYSPNIKERMDHSCAVFSPDSEMIAHAEHIPVHLGAMPMTIKSILREIDTLEKGDVVITNDPFEGGTHLPDITLLAPIYVGNKLIGYVANRAHHSDVGGRTPGSMPGDSEEIFEEGIIIPPVRLYRRGRLNRDILKLILANVRTPRIRRGDLYAQIAALNRGIMRVKELASRYSIETFLDALQDILEYSEKLSKRKISALPKGTVQATDYLDDGGERYPDPIAIRVKVTIKDDEMIFDFSSSDPEVPSSINAPKSVTISSVYYAFKSIVGADLPNNEGIYRPLKIITKKGTIVDATYPRAVVGGNVETSQRIVDVIFLALSKIMPDRIPAASQGTMNNIAIGGINPNTGDPFTFYETIGGGAGARPNRDGVDGVHTHMTNTMNTPIEEIERNYPILILEYSLRKDSGGLGKWRGGLGIIRKYKALARIRASLLGERHKYAPWGLLGGQLGKTGKYYIIREGETIILPSKTTIILEPNDILVIETPGGGGYGDPKERAEELVIEDIKNEKISKETYEGILKEPIE